MSALRRLSRRLVRTLLVSAAIAVVRDRLIAANRAKHGPEPLDRA